MSGHRTSSILILCKHSRQHRVIQSKILTRWIVQYVSWNVRIGANRINTIFNSTYPLLPPDTRSVKHGPHRTYEQAKVFLSELVSDPKRHPNARAPFLAGLELAKRINAVNGMCMCVDVEI